MKKNAQALIDIQTNDKRGEWRASATYLLAYLKDGKKVVQQMVDRIKDNDVEVRIKPRPCVFWETWPSSIPST